MAFLPQTKRQKHTLFILIMLMPVIALEIYFGVEYAAERETDFHAFLWDTETLWKLKPGFHGTAFGEAIHVNQNGFRGGQETPRRSEHDFRIIALGDSRTYGYEVGDFENYPMILQTQLRRRGIDAEVLNAGTHGYSAVQARAKLEQCLPYKPDAAVFAPGYNDRRYTVARPPDSEDWFSRVAATRKVLGVLQWSNSLFAFLHELGESRLQEIRQNLPGLDEVPVRVSPERFRIELQRFLQICRENDILPVLMLIYADPYVYGDIEAAGPLVDDGKYSKAIDKMMAIYPTLHNQAHMLYRYYMGRCYMGLDQEEKAREQFSMHTPTGSLHGEAVLRRFALYKKHVLELAEQEDVIVVDGREAIMQAADGEDPEAYFRSCFVDESHYNAAGHRAMGQALAEALAARL